MHSIPCWRTSLWREENAPHTHVIARCDCRNGSSFQLTESSNKSILFATTSMITRH